MIWIKIVPHVQKSNRITAGARIENKFLDLLELSYDTYFSNKEKKLEKILECIHILNTLKFLISIIWEGKLISNKHYEEISLKLNEIGKMLNGWKKGLDKNSRLNKNLS